MTFTLHRPQPLGLDPYQAGLLLVPAPDVAEAEVAARALRGAATLPGAWAVLAHARRDDLAGARAALDGDDSPLAAYDRFVLDPSAAAHAALRADAPPAIALLADVAAYVLGLADETPAGAAIDAHLDGELAAHARIVEAAWHLEQGRPEAALAALDRAAADARAASPVLAMQAIAQATALRRERAERARAAGEPPPSDAATHALADRYAEALALLGDDAPAAMRAELRLQRALLWHEAAEALPAERRRGPLLEAARGYQDALREGLSADATPEAFALAHTNLALAYLALPDADATDRLRRAVAVQSLRAARNVWDRDAAPEPWARAQMHLANALVYLPSGHVADNLVQAVELYEELLAVRDRALDPLGHARVLANQANALAHLGLHGEAIEKLSEARKLFHWHGEPALAEETLAQLDRITARRAELAGTGG